MLNMTRPVSQKCIDCAKNYDPKIVRDTHINYKPKPDCWNDNNCPKKRSYYRNLEHYRQKQRDHHRYIKFLGNKCVLCKSKQELEAHHVVPQCRNGKDEQSNIITLCKPCHRVITSYHKTIGYI